MTTNEFIHRKDLGYQYIIDLASSDASYYYPVVFSYEPPLYTAETLKFHVIRPSVHQDGSSYGSMDLDVEIQRSAWDNTDYWYTCRFFEKSGPLTRWFGVVNHGYHGVVYLRGGRTYYLYSSAPVTNISNLGASCTVRSGEADYEITFGIQTDVNTQPPTSVPSGGTESVIWINAVPNISLESSANIKTPGITLTTGAGSGKILSSDESGNASWGFTTSTSLSFPGSDTKLVTESGTATAIATNYINFMINGGGSVISTGIQGAVQIPWNCSLTAIRLISVNGTSGSITVAVKKSTYSDHPTLTTIDSYSISSSTKSSSSISGVSLSAGDYLYFDVTSATSITQLLITLTAVRS